MKSSAKMKILTDCHPQCKPPFTIFHHLAITHHAEYSWWFARCATQCAPPHGWSQRACGDLIAQYSKRLSRSWLYPSICFMSRSINISHYLQIKPVIRPMTPPDHLPQTSAPNLALLRALSNFPINPTHG